MKKLLFLSTILTIVLLFASPAAQAQSSAFLLLHRPNTWLFKQTFAYNPGIQITAGAGAGLCLISDASGNATWQACGAGGGSTGPFLSSNTPRASAGMMRLANVDKICWRNAGNSADDCFWLDGSDNFQLDKSIVIEGSVAGNDTGAGTSFSLDPDSGLIFNTPGVPFDVQTIELDPSTGSISNRAPSGGSGEDADLEPGQLTISDPAGTSAVFGNDITTHAGLLELIRTGGHNPASAGAIRLSNNFPINWRNAADSADLGLNLNASNIFTLDASLQMPSASTINWNNDTFLLRTNANILSQQNSTTAQEFRVYGTTASSGTFTAIFSDRLRSVQAGSTKGQITWSGGNVIIAPSPGASFQFQNNFLSPSSTNTVDIGTAALSFANFWLGKHLNATTDGGTTKDIDLAGTIALSSATSASATFATAYTSAPVCILSPISDPGLTQTWWVTTSTTAVTANVSTSATITFNYICMGSPK